ncbi:MAG: sulfurtransferase complex subunit TusC [Hahellaceae bacterium]|nr:sulfurtransferase complex subunit TusC [Hahellaceae bacterium]
MGFSEQNPGEYQTLNVADKEELLIIFSRAPASSAFAREALDACLAASAFDCVPALLFLEDGIFGLLEGQQASLQLARAPLSKNLGVLPIYGVDKILVSERGMAQRGLTINDLCLPIEVVNDDDICHLVHSHNKILSF